MGFGAMMDTSLIRLIAQVMLTGWALFLIVALIVSKGRINSYRGMWSAVVGLSAFTLWQFLASISIYDSAIVPRKSLIPYFAILESITAGAAWLWLVFAMRNTFRFRLRMNHGLNGNGNGNA